MQPNQAQDPETVANLHSGSPSPSPSPHQSSSYESTQSHIQNQEQNATSPTSLNTASRFIGGRLGALPMGMANNNYMMVSSIQQDHVQDQLDLGDTEVQIENHDQGQGVREQEVPHERIAFLSSDPPQEDDDMIRDDDSILQDEEIDDGDDDSFGNQQTETYRGDYGQSNSSYVNTTSSKTRRIDNGDSTSDDNRNPNQSHRNQHNVRNFSSNSNPDSSSNKRKLKSLDDEELESNGTTTTTPHVFASQDSEMDQDEDQDQNLSGQMSVGLERQSFKGNGNDLRSKIGSGARKSNQSGNQNQSSFKDDDDEEEMKDDDEKLNSKGLEIREGRSSFNSSDSPDQNTISTSRNNTITSSSSSPVTPKDDGNGLLIKDLNSVGDVSLSVRKSPSQREVEGEGMIGVDVEEEETESNTSLNESNRSIEKESSNENHTLNTNNTSLSPISNHGGGGNNKKEKKRDLTTCQLNELKNPISLINKFPSNVILMILENFKVQQITVSLEKNKNNNSGSGAVDGVESEFTWSDLKQPSSSDKNFMNLNPFSKKDLIPTSVQKVLPLPYSSNSDRHRDLSNERIDFKTLTLDRINERYQSRDSHLTRDGAYGLIRQHKIGENDLSSGMKMKCYAFRERLSAFRSLSRSWKEAVEGHSFWRFINQHFPMIPSEDIEYQRGMIKHQEEKRRLAKEKEKQDQLNSNPNSNSSLGGGSGSGSASHNDNDQTNSISNHQDQTYDLNPKQVEENLLMFKVSTIQMMKSCLICNLNGSLSFHRNAAEYPVAEIIEKMGPLGAIGICKHHDVITTIADNDKRFTHLRFCAQCLVTPMQTTNHFILKNFDFESFPDASNICGSCRNDSLTWQLERLFSNSAVYAFPSSQGGYVSPRAQYYSKITNNLRSHYFVEFAFGSTASSVAAEIGDEVWLTNNTRFDALWSLSLKDSKKRLEKLFDIELIKLARSRLKKLKRYARYNDLDSYSISSSDLDQELNLMEDDYYDGFSDEFEFDESDFEEEYDFLDEDGEPIFNDKRDFSPEEYELIVKDKKLDEDGNWFHDLSKKEKDRIKSQDEVSEKIRCREVAFNVWAHQRLSSGIWLTASEQNHLSFGDPPKLLLQALPIEVRFLNEGETMIPELDLSSSNKITWRPPPLPTAGFMRMADDAILKAMRVYFKKPLLRLVAELKSNPTGYLIAQSITPADLLSHFRNLSGWLIYNKRDSSKPEPPLPSLPKPLPKIPASTLDLGQFFLTHLMEYFKEVAKPLEECDCGVCKRTKRKREDEEEEKRKKNLDWGNTR